MPSAPAPSIASPLPDPLRLWGRADASRVAIVDRSIDARLTYAELDARATRWQAVLDAHGVRAGDRVATLAGNRSEQVELLYACMRMRVALVPLNWRLAVPELARVVRDAAPALVVGEGRFRQLGEGAARGASADVRWIDADDDAPGLLARAAPPIADVPARAEDAALVLYTSGSTGGPKGAVIPHRQLAWNAIATTEGWRLGSADVAPVTTPFFHTSGWGVFALPLWQRGGRVVLQRRFEAGDFLDLMADERCTLGFAVPTQLVMLLEQPRWGAPLPSLRWMISGGAPCPAPVAARVRMAGVRLRDAYGLTECGPNCFMTTDAATLAHPERVGWPLPHLEMRLLDEEGRAIVAPDVPGELCLRGPQLFGGYLNAPARTAEAFTPDGWLRTGDLARRDADGAYTICGRRSDMFISGGENVFPAEIEAALLECGGVADVAVVGVPDARWGEVGCAFVVRRAGAAADEAAMLRDVRGRLAAYKVPRRIVLVDALPRLGSGKVDRRALSRIAGDGPTAAAT